jgi:hypothetical protein
MTGQGGCCRRMTHRRRAGSSSSGAAAARAAGSRWNRRMQQRRQAAGGGDMLVSCPSRVSVFASLLQLVWQQPLNQTSQCVRQRKPSCSMRLFPSSLSLQQLFLRLVS